MTPLTFDIVAQVAIDPTFANLPEWCQATSAATTTSVARRRPLRPQQQHVADNPHMVILSVNQVDYTAGLLICRLTAYDPDKEEMFNVCLRVEGRDDGLDHGRPL